MRALVITSDDATASRIARRLSNERIDFDRARTCADATGPKLARSDVVLLDQLAGEINSRDLICAIKKSQPKVPVVICSDRDTVEAMTRGFGIGADGSIVLPDEERRLAATLYQLLGQPPPKPLVLRSSAHEMELFDTWARVDGERVFLSKAEFRIIDLLARRRGEVISKADLLRHALPDLDDVCLRVFDVYLTHARKIMSCASGGHNFIRTVWGSGFTFNDECDE